MTEGIGEASGSEGKLKGRLAPNAKEATRLTGSLAPKADGGESGTTEGVLKLPKIKEVVERGAAERAKLSAEEAARLRATGEAATSREVLEMLAREPEAISFDEDPRRAAEEAVGPEGVLRGSLLEARRHQRSELPTFTEMRPESNAVKVYRSGGVELRQSSSVQHQDGVAYNPDTSTVVVCDGMGGIGWEGSVKDNFAFTLAHAAAELPDISVLREPASIGPLVGRAKELLASMGAHPEDQASDSRMKGGVGASRNVEWGATLVAVQEKPGEPGVWQVVTFGDSSAVKLGNDGKIQEGFGEACQLIKSGQKNPNGSAKEEMMGSYIGMAKGTLEGFAQYESRGLVASFGTVRLEPGEKIVLVTDAYMQKSSPVTLEDDARLTGEDWASNPRAPKFDDDTTMAIIAST
ncbi:MAG TPA: hypothetical protein VLF89_10195 [Candidatus Saccharimonadales bacterium]|nr:hypothetical protein [Candidatus Saccharimonadales bacterium]